MNLPRDLQVAYFIGRVAVVKTSDCWQVFYGSPHTARTGFGRLTRLGLLRSFERVAPSCPKWFSLTDRGLAWVADEVGCAEEELRAPSGISRLNLSAISMRNRLWASLIVSARADSRVKLELVRPEWELRRAKTESVSIVPDALVVLAAREESRGQARKKGSVEMTRKISSAWMVELDAGSERRAVWQAKAKTYRKLHDQGALYGESRWRVLAVVPTLRRARTVAEAVIKGGGGSFTLLGVEEELLSGRALDRLLWYPADLAQGVAEPRASLVDALLDDPTDSRQHTSRGADQRARS